MNPLDQYHLQQKALRLARSRFYPTIGSYQNRILFLEKASFEYPDFDPCRAKQVLIKVTIPAFINMQNKTFTYTFSEDDINSI
jgi:hypothetical protein